MKTIETLTTIFFGYPRPALLTRETGPIPTSAVVYHCFIVRDIICSHLIELTSLMAHLEIMLSENRLQNTPHAILYHVTIGTKQFGLLFLFLIYSYMWREKGMQYIGEGNADLVWEMKG